MSDYLREFSVPIQLTLNESLIQEVAGSPQNCSVVINHMRDLFEDGKPIDDKATLLDRMKGVHARGTGFSILSNLCS